MSPFNANLSTFFYSISPIHLIPPLLLTLNTTSLDLTNNANKAPAYNYKSCNYFLHRPRIRLKALATL